MGTVTKIRKNKNRFVKITNKSVFNRFGTCKSPILIEEESLRIGIKKYGHDAFKKALSKGISATVLEGNFICKIAPDGGKKIVAQIADAGVKVSHRTLKIE